MLSDECPGRWAAIWSWGIRGPKENYPGYRCGYCRRYRSGPLSESPSDSAVGIAMDAALDPTLDIVVDIALVDIIIILL